MTLRFKDGVPENRHPLNLVDVDDEVDDEADDGVADEVVGDQVIEDETGGDRGAGAREAIEGVDRPPLFEVYMRMAEELAKRSTCSRLQVGTVITDARLENVVAIGYNGNARGFPNRCDSDEAGRCGCIHSEMNALVKSPGQMRDKVAFVTASPCVMCAKLMVQANVSHVFYRHRYRIAAGLDVLERGGVETVHYTRWQDAWRDEEQ